METLATCGSPDANGHFDNTENTQGLQQENEEPDEKTGSQVAPRGLARQQQTADRAPIQPEGRPNHPQKYVHER